MQVGQSLLLLFLPLGVSQGLFVCLRRVEGRE